MTTLLRRRRRSRLSLPDVHRAPPRRSGRAVPPRPCTDAPVTRSPAVTRGAEGGWSAWRQGRAGLDRHLPVRPTQLVHVTFTCQYCDTKHSGLSCLTKEVHHTNQGVASHIFSYSHTLSPNAHCCCRRRPAFGRWTCAWSSRQAIFVVPEDALPSRYVVECVVSEVPRRTARWSAGRVLLHAMLVHCVASRPVGSGAAPAAEVTQQAAQPEEWSR